MGWLFARRGIRLVVYQRACRGSRRGSRGLASLTVRVRPSTSWPWSLAIAVLAAVPSGISTKPKPLEPALSIYPLTELNCHLIWEVTRNSPGGDNDVARHDLCPLRQGATRLCHGPGQLGEAFGCATPRCPVCPDRRATVYPRVTVFLSGAVDE